MDPEYETSGERQDERDLTEEWLENYKNSYFVWNQQQFDAIDPKTTDHLLGLFEPSHMHYNHDRSVDEAGEPSLGEMTAKAIDILNKNDKGFFLQVEAGRIDHAHHDTNPYRALSDTIELSHAVSIALKKVDLSETLIIVAADHSHVLTIGGYATRGNPILRKSVSNDRSGEPRNTPSLAFDNRPYTTLGYANGRSFYFLPNSNSANAIDDYEINLSGRADLIDIDTTDPRRHGAERHLPRHDGSKSAGAALIQVR